MQNLKSDDSLTVVSRLNLGHEDATAIESEEIGHEIKANYITTHQQSDEKEQNSAFLALPSEIRTMIYKHLLVAYVTVTPEYKVHGEKREGTRGGNRSDTHRLGTQCH